MKFIGSKLKLLTYNKERLLTIFWRQLGKTQLQTEILKKIMREETEKFMEGFHSNVMANKEIKNINIPDYFNHSNNRCKICGASEMICGIYKENYICEKCLTNRTESIDTMIEKSEKQEQVRRFESGAIRDCEQGKESYVETISWTAFRRFSQYMTSKKNKYGAGNFKKGIPIESYEESLIRHISKYLINKYEGGDLEKNEDHCAAIAFNIFGIMHEEERLKNQSKNQEKV